MEDYVDMECERAREAISARIDREDLGTTSEALERHLSICDGCSEWQDSLVAFADRAATAKGEPDPAVLPAVLGRLVEERATQQDRRARRALRPWRVGLAAIAVVQPAVVVPSLMFEHAHDARELGSLHLALAVGFLFAAVRPSRAWGMLPLVAALVCGLVLTAGVDLVEGNAHATGELAHAVDLVGLGCLWILARRPPTAVLRTRFL